jgi:UDP-N-acetylmuramoyl-L-alanyl-D-glutamate--2,6-diaminopimelate ligase
MIKTFIKKLLPRHLLLGYHKILAILANIIYCFPSRKMIVIGVTGTKGKSSTCVMLVRILEQAGYIVGSTNTIFFKTGKKEWPNTTKQGMPGRFKMQKMLREMVRVGCTHAVIEVTSEGIAQYRHWGIGFNIAIFTNLAPEHIESHGSYSKYRSAKETIFKNLRSGLAKSAIVVNYDDEEAKIFLRHKADEKWITSIDSKMHGSLGESYKYLCADEINSIESGVEFLVGDKKIKMKLHGKFMVRNALLAIAAAQSVGVSFDDCKIALENILKLPGRVEIIESKGFKVIIDYAHEPKSFNAIFEMAQDMRKSGKIISVFGATGGGRDSEKRPNMGSIASKYSDVIILTTDDPYDDDPLKLANDILQGISEKQKVKIIVDRKQAITEALSIASLGDIILVLGKGSERTMAVAGGKYIPWSDKEVIEEILYQ